MLTEAVAAMEDLERVELLLADHSRDGHHCVARLVLDPDTFARGEADACLAYRERLTAEATALRERMRDLAPT